MIVDVVADDREQCGPVIAHLWSCPGVHLRVARLRLGDYLVDGRFLFERKSFTDLVASVVDGRLLRQAARLAACSYRPVVLLEGRGRDLPRTGLSREALLGALIAVTVMFGIPLLRSIGPEESARLMVYAARQARASAYSALPRPGVRPKGRRAVQLRILQGLPGIGPDRAARLLDRFGSVEAVVAASARELREVRGVGSRTAAGIRWAVGEEA